MEDKKESFNPSILTRDGRVYFPTGIEWLIFFSVCGCQWAIDALSKHSIKVLNETKEGEKDEKEID